MSKTAALFLALALALGACHRTSTGGAGGHAGMGGDVGAAPAGGGASGGGCEALACGDATCSTPWHDCDAYPGNYCDGTPCSIGPECTYPCRIKRVEWEPCTHDVECVSGLCRACITEADAAHPSYMDCSKVDPTCSGETGAVCPHLTLCWSPTDPHLADAGADDGGWCLGCISADAGQ